MSNRTLIRGGSPWIVRWEADPPIAPVPMYSVMTKTTRHVFPTHAEAVQFADRDRCPLLQAIPFNP